MDLLEVIDKMWGFILKILGGAAGLIFICTGGSSDRAIKALLIAMSIDYTTGVIKAIYTKSLNSKTGTKGFLKKILILCIITLAHHLDIILGIQVYKYNCRFISISFYFANEGLSILENSVMCGVPVPAKIKELLEQCKNKDIKK